MELGDKTPYTGKCIWEGGKRVGYRCTKSCSHYVLYLPGGGGGTLCGLCKVPGTENRPSQFPHHLPQWWASTHRSTRWELFLTTRWILCLLVSRHGCSCGGEECLTEEPECLVWSTAGNGQGKDKEGLLLHLTQGETESCRGVVILVPVGKLWLWTISEPHLRYLDVIQCHPLCCITLLACSWIALSSFNFKPESSNQTKIVSHGSFYFLHSNFKCVSISWGSFPFQHESSPAKSVLPPE